MKKQLRILFHLGHPAHFHLFHPTIDQLKNHGHIIDITIKQKDVLEKLLNESGYNYKYLLKKKRGDGALKIGLGLLRRSYELYRHVKQKRPDIMIGTSAEIAHIGRISGITNINVNEDDWNVIPIFSYLTYPFTSYILAPLCCSVGHWKKKSIQYDSYHELAYLHPKYFNPQREHIKLALPKNKYFIIRFAELNAHHDFGKKGITLDVAKKIINILKEHGTVCITSERQLEPELEKYRINISPSKIHDALAFADMFIGDSQTMAAEAAVLGTPSLRFNDFVGKIGYLEELEHKYKLTYGIKTSEPDKLIMKINELLLQANIKEEWEKRRNVMLEEKIDITAFLVWLIENYPESLGVARKNPSISKKYRF